MTKRKYIVKEFLATNTIVNAFDRALYKRLGVCLYYSLADFLTDDLSHSCPALAHCLGDWLDSLGPVFIREDPAQCLPLLGAMVARPAVHRFLISSFDPNVVGLGMQQRADVYRIVQEIPDAESHFAFSLLSKIELHKWLKEHEGTEGELFLPRAVLADLVRAFARTGPDPYGEDDQDDSASPSERAMIHDKHRMHLRAVTFTAWPKMHAQVLRSLLSLTSGENGERGSLHPSVWDDLFKEAAARSRSGSPPPTTPQELAERNDGSTVFGTEQVREFAEIMTEHFTRQRGIEGQKGLHASFGKDAAQLAPLYELHGCLLVKAWAAVGESESSVLSATEGMWREVTTLFRPWLFPLSRDSMSQWIREMCPTKILLPWRWQDKTGPAEMLNAFASVSAFAFDRINGGASSVLANVWTHYVETFCHADVQDAILEPVHKAYLAKLPWGAFRPDCAVLDTMARLIDAYLPSCHSFLGRVFLQVPWAHVLGHLSNSGRETVGHFLPLLLKLVVKLSAEPAMRQGKDLSNLIRDLRHWPWWMVGACEYESVVQWCVMSQNPTVVVLSISERPLDGAVFRLLQAASGHFYHPQSDSLPRPSDPGQRAELQHKRLSYVRYCVKHLTSCASKHRSFLQANPDRLSAAVVELFHTTERVVSKSK